MVLLHLVGFDFGCVQCSSCGVSSQSVDCITCCSDTHRIARHIKKWIHDDQFILCDASNHIPHSCCNHYVLVHMDSCEVLFEHCVALSSHVFGQSHAHVRVELSVSVCFFFIRDTPTVKTLQIRYVLKTTSRMDLTRRYSSHVERSIGIWATIRSDT